MKEKIQNVEKKAGSLWKEFKHFSIRGNAIDLAVGVIIGGAFGKIVTSIVNDLLTPIIGSFTGGVSFAERFIALDWKPYANIDAARAAKAPVFAYGSFIQNVIDFVFIAIIVFIVVKAINKLMRKQQEEDTRKKEKPPLTTEQQLLTEIRDELRKNN